MMQESILLGGFFCGSNLEVLRQMKTACLSITRSKVALNYFTNFFSILT